MAEVTVLNPGNIFSTLAANGTGEASPLARALRSATIDPVGIQTIGSAEERPLPGFTADLPALVARPLEFSVENFLQLAAQTVLERIDVLQEEVDALSREIEAALTDSTPILANPAGQFLASADFAAIREAAQNAPSPAAEETAAAAAPIEISSGAARTEGARFADFSARPTERQVFGTSYTGLAADDSLTTQFISRTALSDGEQVSLADLVLAGTETDTGTDPRRFAVFLTGRPNADFLDDPSGEDPFNDAYGALVDSLGDPVANGTEIDEDQLDDIFFTADSNNRALDYLSIVEIRDGGGGADTRGDFQTVAISSNLAPRDRIQLSQERIRDFTFATESGTAFRSINLVFDGVDDEGLTDILSAIEQGYVRVTVAERLEDGTSNAAVIDRLNSDANRLQADFAYAATGAGLDTEGLTVEVRALDPAFDISGITVRAVFG